MKKNKIFKIIAFVFVCVFAFNLKVNAKICKYSLNYETEYDDYYIQYIRRELCNEFYINGEWKNYCKYPDKAEYGNFISSFANLAEENVDGKYLEFFRERFSNLEEKNDYFKPVIESLLEFFLGEITITSVEFTYDTDVLNKNQNERIGTFTYWYNVGEGKNEHLDIKVDLFGGMTNDCVSNVFINYYRVVDINLPGFEEFNPSNFDKWFPHDAYLIHNDYPFENIVDANYPFKYPNLIPLFLDGTTVDSLDNEVNTKERIQGSLCLDKNYYYDNSGNEYEYLDYQFMDDVFIENEYNRIIEDIYGYVKDDKVKDIPLSLRKEFLDVVSQLYYFNGNSELNEIVSMVNSDYKAMKNYNDNVNNCIDNFLEEGKNNEKTTYTVSNHEQWYRKYFISSKLRNFDATYVLLDILSTERSFLNEIYKYNENKNQLAAMDEANNYATQKCSTASSVHYSKCIEQYTNEYYESDEFMAAIDEECRQYGLQADRHELCVKGKIDAIIGNIGDKTYDEILQEQDEITENLDLTKYYNKIFESIGIELEDIDCEFIDPELQKYIDIVTNIIRIGGPVLVIILTAFDGIRMIASGKEDESKKFYSRLKIRLICVILLILVPTVINYLVGLTLGSVC